MPTPTSVSGSSVVEVCRWSRLHSVSPCRTSQSSCATSLIRTLWHVHACHARAHDLVVHDLVAGARAAGRRRRLRRPGPAVHQPHHPAADAPGHLGPRRGRPVPAAADDGAAGRRWLAGRRGAGEALAQRRGAARRAPRRRGGGAGAGHRPDVRRLRRRTRGVRRGAGAGRRRRQHAGGRGGARLRPADPAVVPRRLDGRRRGRRRAHAGRPRPVAGRRARRWCPPWWRWPPRSCRGSASPTPATWRCRGGRSCWSAWRWCSSTWSTPRRPRGDRRSSTTRSRRRPGWWRWRRSPTSWPRW